MIVVLLVLALAMNSGAIYRLLTSDSYLAEFSEAGSLQVGNEVRIGGYVVGKVTAIELAGNRVNVGFTIEHGGRIGNSTRAAIKTASPLGLQFLSVLPSGDGELEGTIPLRRTDSPYDVTDILSTLTEKAQQIDSEQLSAALGTLSAAFQDTPADLRQTLSGVSRLSATIAKRDQDLRELLTNANGVTGVLALRNQQLSQLFTQGNLLLNELYERRDTIHQLLVNGTALLDEVNGLARENEQQIGPALEQLKGALDTLTLNERALAAAIQGLNLYAGSLADAVSAGPWFSAYIPNLIPTNLAPLLPQLLGGNK
jgi:phospholipid/cholesterol/gamma-HCH transport system substrate-binding protein